MKTTLFATALLVAAPALAANRTLVEVPNQGHLGYLPNTHVYLSNYNLPIRGAKTTPTKTVTTTTETVTKTTATTTMKPALQTLNVYFETNETELAIEGAAELKPIAALLKANKTAKIEVVGHADPRGPASINNTLSAKRAAAVKQYLLESGARSEQIATVARGSSDLLNPGDNPSNRRATVRVMAK